MDNTLIIAVLAGLGGMLGWGFADLFAKKVVDEVGDVTSLAWGNIFGLITFTIVGVILFLHSGKGFALPTEMNAWVFLAIFGAAESVIYYFLYKGFGKGRVAILNPVFATFAVITVLLSVIFFGETMSWGTAIGLIVTIIGILWISVDLKALRGMGKVSLATTPGLKEVVIATIGGAFWTLFWGLYANGQEWFSHVVIMYFVTTMTTLLIAHVTKTSLKIKNKKMWKWLALIGFCEVFAYASITMGFALTDHLSTVVVISNAFSLPTIFLARVFLKEKVTRSETFAGLVIVLGITIVSLLAS